MAVHCWSLIVLYLALLVVATHPSSTSTGHNRGSPSPSPQVHELHGRDGSHVNEEANYGQSTCGSRPGSPREFNPNRRRADGPSSSRTMPTPSSRSQPKKIRRNFNTLIAREIATVICPGSLTGCPVGEPGSMKSLPSSYSEWLETGFECVDIQADLRACGGCPSLDSKFDCSTITGAKDVACISGKCIIDSCRSGYTFNSTHKSCLSR